MRITLGDFGGGERAEADADGREAAVLALADRHDPALIAVAQSFFQRGSAVLTPHFQRLLVGLSGVLAKVDNKLIISGHTDSTPYRGIVGGYNNWNLSGDRALRARNVLVDGGLVNASLGVSIDA